jgi:hypothetical protein
MRRQGGSGRHMEKAKIDKTNTADLKPLVELREIEKHYPGQLFLKVEQKSRKFREFFGIIRFISVVEVGANLDV